MVDSNGDSVTKSSDKYDIYTYRVQYNTSTTFDVSIRTTKNCYYSDNVYRYFSTNGFGNPTDKNNWDLILSYNSGQTDMPQMEISGISLWADHQNITNFYDIDKDGLTLSIYQSDGNHVNIKFTSAYIYVDRSNLYIIYKAV